MAVNKLFLIRVLIFLTTVVSVKKIQENFFPKLKLISTDQLKN